MTTPTGLGPTDAERSASLSADLDALEEIIARIASADIVAEQLAHSGPVLGRAAVRAHRAMQRLQGKRMQWLSAEEADGRWALDGSRTFATHVAHTHKISQSTAKADVRLARQLRDEIGRFAAALRGGGIGMEQVRIVARGALTSRVRIDGMQQPVRDPDAQRDPDVQGDHARAADANGADAHPADEVSSDADAHAADEVSTDAEAHGADEDRDESREGATGGPDNGEAVTLEQFLLRRAQHMRPEHLRQLVLHYAAVADPDADERGYRKGQEREYLDVSQTLNGYHLAGFLTKEHGQQVSAALNAVMGKPIRGDQRTAGQRRAQGLADMARIVVDQGLGGTSASVRPHVGVMVGFADFARMFGHATGHTCEPKLGEQKSEQATDNGRSRPGAQDNPRHHQNTGHNDSNDSNESVSPKGSTGHGSPGAAFTRSSAEDPAALGGRDPQWDWATLLDNGPAMWSDATGPVPMQVLRRMVRCGDIYRVLFSPDNEVLNHGRHHRTFTAGQRRAIVARDRHCAFPGCTAPPALCETHHATVRWADNGNTDVSNGALLCFHHHDLVEARQISMARGDDHWQFFRPDGTQLHEGELVGRRTPWKQRE